MSEGAVALGDAEDRSEGPAEVDQGATPSDSASDADSPAGASEDPEGNEPAPAVEEEPPGQPEPESERIPEPVPESERPSEQVLEPGPEQVEAKQAPEPEAEQAPEPELEPTPEAEQAPEPELEPTPEAEQAPEPEPEQAEQRPPELDGGVSASATSEPENATAPAEAAMSGTRKLLFSAVAVIALMAVGLVGGMWYFGRDEPTNAVAGDCLAKDGIDHVDGSVKIVRCDASTAKYKVIGRVENQSEAEANATSTLCQQYSGTEFIFWEGVRGKKGTVLCLATNG